MAMQGQVLAEHVLAVVVAVGGAHDRVHVERLGLVGGGPAEDGEPVDPLGERVRVLADQRPQLAVQPHDVAGLAVALRDLCEKYSQNYSLDVEIQAQGLESDIPPHIALCLFRVAQEAMANAWKHSGSKKIVLTVARRSDQIRLAIKDFGVGFDPLVQTPGIGLLTMRERLRTCGGALEVTSSPNCGTEIRAELRLAEERAGKPVAAAVQALM